MGGRGTLGCEGSPADAGTLWERETGSPCSVRAEEGWGPMHIFNAVPDGWDIRCL